MRVLDEDGLRVMEGEWDPSSFIRSIVGEGDQEDPFYVLDLGEVVSRYKSWRKLMPRVEPFYAVKCNEDKKLLITLAALGTGFDCASKAEIEVVTSLGVRPERIIFANPTKMASHIHFSKAAGVNTMTFDNEHELIKIKEHIPNARLVLRIRCDAANVKHPFGVKFGCDPEREAFKLMKMAAAMQLHIVGVSFHVGTDTSEYTAYARAIRYARSIFDQGSDLGHRMTLLDIGGGFPGSSDSSMEKVAATVNHALATYFPDEHIKVIAEPGRYFAQAPYTLAVMIHAKREVLPKDALDAERHTMYFVNDGVYGSFSGVITYSEKSKFKPLQPNIAESEEQCSIWGPSCDSIDCISESALLPPLAVGDWLVFQDMGAYTFSVATTFNGFYPPKGHAVIDHKIWPSLRELMIKGGYYYNAPLLPTCSSSSSLSSDSESSTSPLTSPPEPYNPKQIVER